jgi:hypothetical protein
VVLNVFTSPISDKVKDIILEGTISMMLTYLTCSYMS